MTREPEDRPGEEATAANGSYRLLAVVRGKPAITPEERREQVLTFPQLVGREVLAAMLFLALLIVVSLLFNAPLEEHANPALTPNPAKAPWYFAGLQELLTYFDPWLAGVILPAIIVVGLIVIPYLDTVSDRGIGRWFAFRERRMQVIFFTCCLALWFLLIAVGVWFRGPGWQWYWPWESWDVHKESGVTLRSLPPSIGLLGLGAFLMAGMGAARALYRRHFRDVSPLKYVLSVVFLLLSLGLPLKIILRFSFHIKYILVTPWFNI
jgi:hypothetical protein